MSKACVLLVLPLCWGCRAPLEQWKNAPRARGAFSWRSLYVSPAEDWLEQAYYQSGLEVAGIYQHTPRFAMEYSIGSWVGVGRIFSTSHLAVTNERFSALSTSSPIPNLVLRVGGGLTFVGGDYKMGNQELAALEAIGVYNAELDVRGATGFHVQAEICYVASNGFSVGLLLRYTSAPGDIRFVWWDGATLWYSDGPMGMGSTDIGLTFGARF